MNKNIQTAFYLTIGGIKKEQGEITERDRINEEKKRWMRCSARERGSVPSMGTKG